MNRDSTDVDTTLDLCNHLHRRIVLAVLMDRQEPVTVNDLAKEIATHNHHISITELETHESDQLKFELHHNHLPRLEDAGIIVYDSELDLVEPIDRLNQLPPFTTQIIEDDPMIEIDVR